MVPADMPRDATVLEMPTPAAIIRSISSDQDIDSFSLSGQTDTIQLPKRKVVEPELPRRGSSTDTIIEKVTDMAGGLDRVPMERSATPETAGQYASHATDRVAEHVIRSQCLDNIISALENIPQYCPGQDIVPHVNEVMHQMRNMRDLAVFDEHFQLVMTFYNSLAIRNQWVGYTSNQYKAAAEVLRQYGQMEQLSDRQLLRATKALADLGFNTLPIEILFDDEDEYEEYGEDQALS